MRVFIAVDIDNNELVNNISIFGKKLEESRTKLKLVEKENLHITLKFIGEVDEKDINAIANAVSEGAKGFKKFKIKVVGAGAFPSVSHPRVVWVGVKNGAETLTRLSASISKSLERYGFRGDPKPFKPHITVARIKGYGGRLALLIKEFDNFEFGEMIVEEVRVKRSKLTPQGPIYTTLSRVELE